MSVKIPENDYSAKEQFTSGKGGGKSTFVISTYNLTGNDMVVKTSVFNSISHPQMYFVETPHLRLNYEVTVDIDREIKTFDVKYPMDAFILDKIQTEMQTKKEIFITGSIFISAKNFSQWASKEDNGIHSELFGRSFFISFDKPVSSYEMSRPSNFNAVVPRNSKGELREAGQGTSIDIVYKCNTTSPVSIFTTACGEPLEITGTRSPDGENSLTITVSDDLGTREPTVIDLPCLRKERQKHIDKLEDHGFFYSYSDSLDHTNSKSLQRALSKCTELEKQNKELDKANKALEKECLMHIGKLRKKEDEMENLVKRNDKESLWTKILGTPVASIMGMISNLLTSRISQALGVF